MIRFEELGSRIILSPYVIDTMVGQPLSVDDPAYGSSSTVLEELEQRRVEVSHPTSPISVGRSHASKAGAAVEHHVTHKYGEVLFLPVFLVHYQISKLLRI